MTLTAYDVKAKKKVVIENPKPYQMKNGTWSIRGTSSETGITLYKIVGKSKPKSSQFKLGFFKNLLISRRCGCDKIC